MSLTLPLFVVLVLPFAVQCFVELQFAVPLVGWKATILALIWALIWAACYSRPTHLGTKTSGQFLPAPLHFSSCTHKFFFLQPHNVMQRPKCSYYFLKIQKCI